MKLFSIRNVSTDRYNPPFVARDKDDAIETCRKAIIAGRDISLLVELENLELHLVGDFDATTGYFAEEAACSIVMLSDIPLPEHIKKMIEKLKEVKE